VARAPTALLLLLAGVLLALAPVSAERQTLPGPGDLRPEVAITTATGTDLDEVLAGRTIQHRSEVSRSDRITVIVSIQACQPDGEGTCRASADVVLRAPDGSVHTEMKAIDLATTRGTARLALDAADPAGIYTLHATVRDLNARRFGRAERRFAVR
jgi:hypothetical protein